MNIEDLIEENEALLSELTEHDLEIKKLKEDVSWYKSRLQTIEDLGREVLDWLNKAPFDYSNGNLDSTGTIDEGDVLGWKGHKEIVDKLTEILCGGDTK